MPPVTGSALVAGAAFSGEPLSEKTGSALTVSTPPLPISRVLPSRPPPPPPSPPFPPPPLPTAGDLHEADGGPTADTVVGNGVVAIDWLAVHAQGCAGRGYGEDAVLSARTIQDQGVANGDAIISQSDSRT